MSNKLKATLDADFPGRLDVAVVPIDEKLDARGKVYTISIDGDSYFDWAMPGGVPTTNKAPNDGWKTPLNFETHESYFGAGKGEKGGEAKEKMYEELKAAVAARAA